MDTPIATRDDRMADRRSRHFLGRYYVMLQRVKAGDVVIRHVPDVENPADMLTKCITCT